jgi:hypothetical protein
MPRSKNPDGSGVATTGEVTSPPVIILKGVSAAVMHPVSAQRPSNPPPAPNLMLTVPPKFVNELANDRSNSIVFVKSLKEESGTSTMSVGMGGSGLKPGSRPR